MGKSIKVSGKIPEQLQNPEFRFNLLRKMIKPH